MKVKDIIDKALSDIDDDRKSAKDLLDDVSVWLGGSADRYENAGMVAAKYLEVLQRSNEQRVKLIAILNKKDDDDNYGGDVSPDETEKIYETFEKEEMLSDE